jgi:uncharacterized membrane protein YbhN (UPF0104 family)
VGDEPLVAEESPRGPTGVVPDADDPLAVTPADAAPDEPVGLGRKIAGNALSIGMVVAIFWFLIPKLQAVDLQEVAGLITAPLVVVAVVLGIVNLATNWPPMVTALPGLRLREAAVSNVGPAAVSNTVPEGGAIATGLVLGMQGSWGLPVPGITLGFLTTGLWTTLVRYSMTALALVVYASTGTDSAQLVTIAAIVLALVVAGCVVLALVFRSETLARRLGGLAGRPVGWVARRFHKPPPDLADALVRFRTRTIGLVEARWVRLTVTMVISQLAAVTLLTVMVRMVGVDADTVSLSKIFVAWGATSFASLLVPVPGGVGVAEVVLIGVLTAGLPPEYTSPITAAVLLYRGATWLLPILLGAGAYVFWRYNRSWRLTPEARAGRYPA